jgi:hypothetical protein
VFASLRDSSKNARRAVILAGTGGLKRLSFAYFSLPLQRKVGAAPHRGNASKPTRQRGRQPKPKIKNKKQKPRTATASQTAKPPSRTLGL